LERLAGLALGALAVVVLLQVISRYVLRSPMDWTADGATILMIWVSFLGAAVAGLHRAHFALDFIVDALPQPIALIVRAVANLLTVVILCALAWLGLRFALLSMGTWYASVALPKAVAAAAIPVSAVLMIPGYLIDGLAGLRRARRTQA
jgi:TRAP-type C4-dicarboxylate transport system permease small subunit